MSSFAFLLSPRMIGIATSVQMLENQPRKTNHREILTTGYSHRRPSCVSAVCFVAVFIVIGVRRTKYFLPFWGLPLYSPLGLHQRSQFLWNLQIPLPSPNVPPFECACSPF